MLVYVAPRVGALIEISTSPAKYPAIKSLPVWERGLKSVLFEYWKPPVWVAPRVGAWIEILIL